MNSTTIKHVQLLLYIHEPNLLNTCTLTLQGSSGVTWPLSWLGVVVARELGCLRGQCSGLLLIGLLDRRVGLTMMDRSMIDAANRGALMDKTLAATRHLISNMAIWKATISARAETRALCSSTIRTYPKCTSRSNRLLTTDSTIPGTTVPIVAIIKSASSRRLTVFGRPNEVVSSKQLGVPTKYELQQYAVPTKYEHHHLGPQDTKKTSARSSNLPSQTIPNLRGNASVVSLRSGKELPQLAPQQLPRSTVTDFEPDADSQVPEQDKTVPLPFPTRTIPTRKPESNEELLRMFQKVEINIPILDAIKLIPKYAKFLKELCVHKRKKMRGGVEVGGIVSTLTKNKDFIIGAQQALPKMPCTIGDCTFVDAMLDLGTLINVMPTSIYKSLNLGDLETHWDDNTTSK
ncbi:hypothetical protein CR513_10383, partial [Mucuna pruriens]